LEATTPTVTFSDNKVSNVANNQEITISTPTVSDSTDSRLFVRYYAVVDTNVALISQGLASETKIEFNTNMAMGGSTLYDLAKNGRSFKIVALAYNHFANYEQEYTSDWATLGNDAKKGIGFAELTISVKNGDTVAPEFAVFPTNDTAPEQNASYQVSGVTFYDNSDDAKVMVEITDTDGRIYTDYSVGTLAVDYDNSKSSYKYVFSGVTFTPTNADNEKYYTVTYKLVDKGDNVTAYSFVLLHVTDKTPPVITLKTESRTVELGETLDIKFDTNDNASNDLDNTVTCTDSNGKTHNFASVKGNTIHFEGEKIGTYTLALTSTDEGGNKSTREFTIEVKDTLTPTISVKNSSGSELVFSSNSLELPAIKETEMYNDDGTTATITGIPTATVADSKPENALNTVEFGATGRITITTPNSNDGVSEFVYDLNGNPIGSNTNPLKLTRNGNTFEFTPFGTNFRGEYKIVYSATDNNGNSATSKTITISVGDTEKPSIYLTQTLEDILSKGFILGENDTLEINPKAKIKENTTDYSDVDLYVSDNLGFAYKKANDGTATKDIDDSDDLLVTVNFYITDPNGSTLSKETDTESSKTTYKFTTAGTYTITFYVTDVAGNRSQNVTRKFVVKAKTTTSVDTSTIVGTVLIVISALILAGIIVYLVRGVKLLPKKNKKTSKKADKKTDNKVEE
jgi:large repetitive protein